MLINKYYDSSEQEEKKNEYYIQELQKYIHEKNISSKDADQLNMLDAAVSHLSSRGATRAHLYTDSNCSWKFYELHGFKRTATHRANREERRHDMPRESFLYELDLTA